MVQSSYRIFLPVPQGTTCVGVGLAVKRFVAALTPELAD
jgi:hypothetical protein